MKVVIIVLLVIANTLSAQLTPVCFTTAGTPAVGLSPRCITTGDFNNDGNIDLAVGNYNSSSISVLLGAGTGSFATAVNFNVPSNIVSICSGDFNNDGNADLAIRSLSGSTGTINIVLSLGNGAFTSPVYSISITTSLKNQIICKDFNLDGNQDIMAGVSGNPQLFLGLGTGSLSAPITCGSTIIFFSSCLAVGDFNNDTKPDFAYSAYASGLSGVFLGTGTSSFVPTSTNIATHDFLTVGDYNNDTKIDLMFVDNGNFYTFLGNGTGYYPSGSLTASVTSFFANNVASADFNGDGASDVAATDGNVLGILLSSGWGFYRFAVGTWPTAIATADFNGDGKVDIAVTNGNSNNVSILINTTGGITPTINVVSTTSLLCSGQTATLTASGGVNYVWDSGATTNTLGITGLLTTTYMVTGISANGCAANASITQSVSACLSVDELKMKDEELKIFPNPANEILNVELEMLNGQLPINNLKFTIINAMGQVTREEEITFKENKTTISTKDLANGVYVLSLQAFDSAQADKKQSVSKRFVVAR